MDGVTSEDDTALAPLLADTLLNVDEAGLVAGGEDIADGEAVVAGEVTPLVHEVEHLLLRVEESLASLLLQTLVQEDPALLLADEELDGGGLAEGQGTTAGLEAGGTGGREPQHAVGGLEGLLAVNVALAGLDGEVADSLAGGAADTVGADHDGTLVAGAVLALDFDTVIVAENLGDLLTGQDLLLLLGSETVVEDGEQVGAVEDVAELAEAEHSRWSAKSK